MIENAGQESKTPRNMKEKDKVRKIKKLLGIISISIIPILVLALVGCVSATDLSIEISSPQDGATVSDSPVTVTGTVSGLSLIHI